MIPASGPRWWSRCPGPADAHGFAVLLVAVLLASVTALSQLGPSRRPIPPPPAAIGVDRSAREAARPMAVRPTTGPEAAVTRLSNPINVNTADAEALQALPGIGPGLAERIVTDRETHGPFRRTEDLLRVPGIGPKRWERIRPLVRLTEEP